MLVSNTSWARKLKLTVFFPLVWWVKGKKTVLDLVGKAPKTNAWPVDGLSTKLRTVRETAGTAHALELFYNHEFGSDGSLQGRMDDFWLATDNVFAVRNRYYAVKEHLHQTLDTIEGYPEVRLMELASGSARAIIEAIAERRQGNRKVRALLVDMDGEALADARRLACQYGIESQIMTETVNVAYARKLARDFQPHIIEMVGLLDYLPDERAQRFIGSHVWQSLPPNGRFIVANIDYQPETNFFHTVLDWPDVRYRNRTDLHSLLEDAGFSVCQMASEPLGIHHLAVCAPATS